MKERWKDGSTASERLELTLDLAAAGLQIMRDNLRRRYPDASEQEIESKVDTWLQVRPGAEYGDGPQPIKERRA